MNGVKNIKDDLLEKMVYRAGFEARNRVRVAK